MWDMAAALLHNHSRAGEGLGNRCPNKALHGFSPGWDGYIMAQSEVKAGTSVIPAPGRSYGKTGPFHRLAMLSRGGNSLEQI